MAKLRDWFDLGRNTFNGLSADELTSLYSVEWPETKKMLIADHRLAIEQEPSALRRGVRTVSAVFYGLVKRLAPHRRLLFAVSHVAFFGCIIAILQGIPNPPTGVVVHLVATFLLLTALLAMELIDKIKIRDELVLARDLQASLVPETLPQTPHYEMAAHNQIANTVGGDIYDVVPLADGRLAVLFGDASGHGMAAGLVMAVAHAAFRTQLDVDPSPRAITTSLNRILCRTGGSRSFFSACYLILAPDGSFVVTVAGHPPIIRVDAHGSVVGRIGRGAYPLGVKTNLQLEEVTGVLGSGEKLVLYSDGLTEARNAAGADFGYERVELISSWRPDASPEELIDDLVGELRSFSGAKTPEDDVTVAVIRKR